MADINDIFFKCAKLEEIPATWNKGKDALAAEVQKDMRAIMIDYFERFGPQGVFERFNNRSIAQIIAEYAPGQAAVIDSGEMQGVKWRVTRAKSE
jgi:hypothetical protein